MILSQRVAQETAGKGRGGRGRAGSGKIRLNAVALRAVQATMVPMTQVLHPTRLAVLIAVMAASVLPSCGLVPKPDYKPHDKLAVVPQEFLYTDNHSFNEWLDTPLRLQITDMPLTEVFRHPALRELEVVWVGSLRENPRITIHRVAITRRQILWSMAQDHQLLMLPVIRPGQQSYVEIRQRPI